MEFAKADTAASDSSCGDLTKEEHGSSTSNAALKLSRKRARDRRAQAAMRNRTKTQIDELKAQVATLSAQLQHAQSTSKNNQHHIHQTATVLPAYQMKDEPDSETLPPLIQTHLMTLNSICSRHRNNHSSSTPFSLGDTFDSALLKSWCAISRTETTPARVMPLALDCSTPPISTPPLSASTLTSPAPKYSQPIKSFVLSEPSGVPWHLPPTCPSDRIVQPILEEQRQLVRYLGIDSPVTAENANQPNQAQYGASYKTIQSFASKVAGDLLSTYSDIDTLPKRLACLYSISSVLHWLIFQTRESFEQMPVWMRPCPAQLTIPHPAWMDRVPWPRVRDYMINHQEITFDQWANEFSFSFEMNWPYDDKLVIIADESPCCCPGDTQYRVNPIFEEHIRNLANWRIGHRSEQLYPEFREHVRADLFEFGRLPTLP